MFVMENFSFAFNYHLPWLKSKLSDVTTLNFLISLLKSGLYIYNKRWFTRGFFVSRKEEKLTFTLYCFEYVILNAHLGIDAEEFEKDLSFMVKFLLEFFNNYTYYDNCSISAYEFYLNETFYVNHITHSLFIAHFLPHENEYKISNCIKLKKNKCLIKHKDLILESEDMILEVEKDYSILFYNKNGHYMRRREPITLESYFRNGACEIEFTVRQTVSIKQRKCLLWDWHPDYISYITSGEYLSKILKST